jgi:hypothetical protein
MQALKPWTFFGVLLIACAVPTTLAITGHADRLGAVVAAILAILAGLVKVWRERNDAPKEPL